jgi:branched-chain amino acid transport system ATP-binding protein
MVAAGNLALLLVEQHARVALELTADAIVVDRGRIVHRSASPGLLADPSTLERLMALGPGA